MFFKQRLFYSFFGKAELAKLKRDQVFRGDKLLDDLRICFSNGRPHNRFGKEAENEKWLAEWLRFQNKLLLLKKCRQLNEASPEMLQGSFLFLKKLGISPYTSRLSFLFALLIELYFENEFPDLPSVLIVGISSDLKLGKIYDADFFSNPYRKHKTQKVSQRPKRLCGDCWDQIFQGQFLEVCVPDVADMSKPSNLIPDVFAASYLKNDSADLVKLLGNGDQKQDRLLFWMVLCIEPEKKSELVGKLKNKFAHLTPEIQTWNLLHRFVSSEKGFGSLSYLIGLIHEIFQKSQNIFFLAASLLLFKSFRIDKKYINFYEKWRFLYSELCSNYSNGECSDFLYLDLETIYQNREPSRKISNITFRFFLQFGKNKVHHLMHRKGLRRFSPEIKQGFLDFFSQEFSRLRGPFMKIGQQCSYFGFPVFQQSHCELSKLQVSSHILPFEQIQTKLEKSIPNWRNFFSSFEPKAFASGSTSQVHRATLYDGQRVVVKVLYPKIEELVNQDLRTLQNLIPVLKVFVPTLDFAALFQELAANIFLELNLEQEAEAQLKFREIYKSDPNINIPYVYKEFSSNKVMVSQYIDGVHPEEYFKTALEENKRIVAESICKFTVTSCCHGYFNSDPHPGNYLIQDNRLWVLDFGSVKKWEESNRLAWRATIEAGFSGDRFLFEEFFGQILKLKRNSGGSSKIFFETLKNRSMKYTQNNSLSSFSYEVMHQELTDFFGPSNPNFRKMNINPDFLLGFRVYFGLIAILSLSNTKINSHLVVKQALQETSAFSANKSGTPT